MGYTNELLDSIRKTTDAHPAALTEARARTQLVRTAALQVTTGALRTYGSGSLWQHTQNHPISDGDSGLVLDRRNYPSLGPEGGGAPPDDVVSTLCSKLGPKLRLDYPNARCSTSKRGPKLYFGSQIDGQDPTVDIVVALTRREGNGLWIPNLKKGTWEASDPEEHSRLLNAEPRALRATRRKVIRLLKVWNKQYGTPALSSFHLSVLALEFVKPGVSVAIALLALLDGAATRMAKRLPTVDPAGVSANVKLLTDWDTAERRLRLAAGHLRTAIDSDSDESVVRTELSKIFWDYIEAPEPDGLSSLMTQLRPRAPLPTSALGLSAGAALLAPTRAFGQGPIR